MDDIQFPMFRIEVGIGGAVVYSITKFTLSQAEEKYNFLKQKYIGHDTTIRMSEIKVIKQDYVE